MSQHTSNKHKGSWALFEEGAHCVILSSASGSHGRLLIQWMRPPCEPPLMQWMWPPCEPTLIQWMRPPFEPAPTANMETLRASNVRSHEMRRVTAVTCEPLFLPFRNVPATEDWLILSVSRHEVYSMSNILYIKYVEKTDV